MTCQKTYMLYGDGWNQDQLVAKAIEEYIINGRVKQKIDNHNYSHKITKCPK